MVKRPSLTKVSKPPASADDWVHAEPESNPVQENEAKPKGSSKRRKGKSADPEYKQIGCYIRKDLYRKVKGKAGLEGVEISDVVGELLSRWVEE